MSNRKKKNRNKSQETKKVTPGVQEEKKVEEAVTEEKTEKKETEKTEEKADNKKEVSKTEEKAEKKAEEKKAAEKSEEKAEEKKETEKSEEKAEEKKEAEKSEEKTEDKKAAEKSEEKTEDKKAAEKSEEKTEEKKEAEKSEEKTEEKKEAEKSEEKTEDKKEAEKTEEKKDDSKVLTKADAKEDTKKKAAEVNDKDKKKAEKAGEKKKFPGWAIAVLSVVGGLALIYGVGALYFSMHFMWNSTLNGVDVSWKSAAKAEEAVKRVADDYTLHVTSRTGSSDIAASEIGMEIQVLGNAEDEIAKQNPFLWFLDIWYEKEYDLDTQVVYDSGRLMQAINGLECFESKNMVSPTEPKIVRKNGEFEVKEEDQGSYAKKMSVKKAVQAALSELKTEMDLDEENCYQKTKHTADDKDVTEVLDYVNKIQDMSINYSFNDETVKLDGKTMARWVTVKPNLELEFDEEAIEAFIEELKENHELQGQVINFHTTYGKTVEVTSYIRSNQMNTAVEKEAIIEFLESYPNTKSKNMTRDAAQMASVGDTYIEINLTAQHLYCYEDGKMILETDVVTGCPARGMATPPGIYRIYGHASPATLVGDTYRTTVAYWMPFNSGIGLHDATWQPRFGGSWYLGNGSHGCINLPLSVAKFIYQHYTVGDTVVCYHLPGTESDSYSDARGDKIVTTTEAATEAATEAPATEATTEEATEAPTEEATEAPTE